MVPRSPSPRVRPLGGSLADLCAYVRTWPAPAACPTFGVFARLVDLPARDPADPDDVLAAGLRRAWDAGAWPVTVREQEDDGAVVDLTLEVPAPSEADARWLVSELLGAHTGVPFGFEALEGLGQVGGPANGPSRTAARAPAGDAR